DGCRIEGSVTRSVISPGVYVAPGAVVRDSIIMNDAVICDGALVDRAIIDKQVVVGAKVQVGGCEDNTSNRRAPQRLNTGITLVGKGTRIPAGICIGRNVEVGAHLTESAFTTDKSASGE